MGRIQKYDNLKELFNSELKKVYTKDEYEQQFSLKVNKYLEKMERMVKIFKNIEMPEAFNEELKSQITKLREARDKFGKDVISPFKFLKNKINQ